MLSYKAKSLCWYWSLSFTHFISPSHDMLVFAFFLITFIVQMVHCIITLLSENKLVYIVLWTRADPAGQITADEDWFMVIVWYKYDMLDGTSFLQTSILFDQELLRIALFHIHPQYQAELGEYQAIQVVLHPTVFLSPVPLSKHSWSSSVCFLKNQHLWSTFFTC